MVISQVGLERVDLQVAQGSGKLGAQIAMLVNELFRGAVKPAVQTRSYMPSP